MMGAFFKDDIMSSSTHYSDFSGGYQDPSPLSCLSLETLNSSHRIMEPLVTMTPIHTSHGSNNNNTEMYTPRTKRKRNQEKKTTQYWTPVQRICQLNHALSFVENYTDHKYWDRIVEEFFHSDSILKIELSGLEKEYDLKSLIIPKFFWIWSLSGMGRLQIFPSKIKESFTASPDGEIILNFTSSSDSFLNSFHLSNQMVVNHFGPHDITFTTDSRIVKWTIRIEKHLEFLLASTFSSSNTPTTDTPSHTILLDYSYGFHKNVLMFLDSSIVMASILPDHSSWFTWLITFIQQQNIHCVEYSSFLNLENDIGMGIFEKEDTNYIKNMMDEILEPELEPEDVNDVTADVTVDKNTKQDHRTETENRKNTFIEDDVHDDHDQHDEIEIEIEQECECESELDSDVRVRSKDSQTHDQDLADDDSDSDDFFDNYAD